MDTIIVSELPLLIDTVVDASWLTRRRRRKELAQKEEHVEAKKKLAPKKSKITDLKQMIDVVDEQEIVGSNIPEQELNSQSIFDEDKYALPMELQHEAPKPPMPNEVKKEEEPMIEFNFEGASLLNLVQQIEAIFDVTFITDDAIKTIAKRSRWC